MTFGHTITVVVGSPILREQIQAEVDRRMAFGSTCRKQAAADYVWEVILALRQKHFS